METREVNKVLRTVCDVTSCSIIKSVSAIQTSPQIGHIGSLRVSMEYICWFFPLQSSIGNPLPPVFNPVSSLVAVVASVSFP
ncbi:hypothetical protein AVEN_208022-1 [Araneus ventricosus]|uniref:Uncharacterized protein n=1 Tax=Araneus ventricosus TaxID=182803 RepID=A0A4Y2F3Z5_ARAVE|nr:hypothetical protein AVEN_208022-1 [Araneus ventricosus]